MSRTVHLEWFERRGPRAGSRDAQATDAGLRFACTMCGACCSGAEGYVSFTDDEAMVMAEQVGVDLDAFLDRYTHDTAAGRSLKERPTDSGYDCVFLDRETIPGKAICSLYDARPAQCRTWPFWKSNLSSEHAWRRAAVGCPGVDRGSCVTPIETIKAQRGVVEM